MGLSVTTAWVCGGEGRKERDVCKNYTILLVAHVLILMYLTIAQSALQHLAPSEMIFYRPNIFLINL